MQNDGKKYNDFKFEFRNSVEHWYPQHPYDLQQWNKGDRFGNLCLVPRHINSRFSNMDPAKKNQRMKSQLIKGALNFALCGMKRPMTTMIGKKISARNMKRRCWVSLERM